MNKKSIAATVKSPWLVAGYGYYMTSPSRNIDQLRTWASETRKSLISNPATEIFVFRKGVPFLVLEVDYIRQNYPARDENSQRYCYRILGDDGKIFWMWETEDHSFEKCLVRLKLANEFSTVGHNTNQARKDDQT